MEKGFYYASLWASNFKEIHNLRVFFIMNFWFGVK